MNFQEVKKPTESKSLAAVANFMGISYITLFRMVKSGKIKVTNRAKTGSKPIYGITPEALQEYYDQVSNTTEGNKGINK